SAVRLATPNWPDGSDDAPDLMIRETSTTGTSCISTIQTASPFDSVRFWIGGSFRPGAGPVFGALERSGGVCWAPSETVIASSVIATRVFISRLSPGSPTTRAVDRQEATGEPPPERHWIEGRDTAPNPH